MNKMLPISLVALSLGLAACSSNTSSSTSTTKANNTTTSMARPTTTLKPAPTTSTTKVSSACKTADLAVAAGQPQGAAGHISIPLVFTNTTKTPCTMTGYPGVAALNSAGSEVAQATRSTGTPITTITVAPGQSASALVTGTDVPTGTETSCPTWPALLVTAPNDTLSVKVAVQVPGCPGFSIRPVVAGTSGM